MLFCCLRRNVVAFCYTLRSRLPPSTNSAAYQRLVSSTVAMVCRSWVYCACAQSVNSTPLSQNRDFCLPHLHSTPALAGSTSEYHYDGMEKLECWRKFEDMFIRFDTIHECDRRTDGHTTPHDGIGRACIASRGKNVSDNDNRLM